MKIGAGPRLARTVGRALATAAVGLLMSATWIAPYGPADQFSDHAYAPPTQIHVIADGRLTTPYFHPVVLENRLARIYREDTTVRVPLRWFGDGRLLASGDSRHPLLLFGADALGRDVFSRFVLGARLSLGVALLGVAGALLVGALVGSLAGATGGTTDRALMVAADFLVAVPAAYLVLVLRGVLPPVLTTGQTFFIMAGLFTVAAWPHAARGVRAIVAAERSRDYAEAARAVGAGRWRVARHLVPAARGFLATELLLLLPALLVAEATISFLGLGFSDTDASWGTLLQDAANAHVLLEAPWLLAPAVGLFLVVLSVHLIGSGRFHTSPRY